MPSQHQRRRNDRIDDIILVGSARAILPVSLADLPSLRAGANIDMPARWNCWHRPVASQWRRRADADAFSAGLGRHAM